MWGDTFYKHHPGHDEFGDDDQPYEGGGYGPRDPKCKRCGSTDVRWRQQGGKWVLFSLEPGKVHVCPIRDSFDVVKE